MKENNRNQKLSHKKNIVLSKKEIKIVNHILDFKKANKSNICYNNNKNQINKKPSSPNKLEPIKVRLTPINKRYNSKGKKFIIIKDSNANNKNNNYNNTVYLSPTHEINCEKGSVAQPKLDKKINLTESRNDIKEENINRNCSTPYRRILHAKSKDTISPSTSVIIKNFNYNNVYNINIDNEKTQNKKNNKLNSKTITKNENKNGNHINNNNNNDNESISKYSCKNIVSRKFTYNKPKTSSSMNVSCSLSKRNRSRDIYLMNDNKKEENNKTMNKNETVFSKFITEGNNLKNCRNINLPIPNLITSGEKIEKKKFIVTPHRYKSNNKYFNMTVKTSNINDYNLASQTINNNTYSNNFVNNDSYINGNLNKTGLNTFYNSPNVSLSTNYMHRNVMNSPKVCKKYNNKIENIKNDDNNNDNENKDIIFNLNDLFIFEDRINDIVSAFNKTNNIYDLEASNECNEFINFYSKSSLRGIFPNFFKDNNKLIIESSINLFLLFISIIYNLSTNNFLFNDIISTINNILSYLKINFALYIKQIQIYYGVNIVTKNYTYFQPFNNFLNNNNINDIEEEDDITYKIYQNCKIMTNEIKIIMKYYEKIDKNYYNFYIKIFNNISIQNENDLLNYLFNISTKVNNNASNIITVNKNNSTKNINNINNITKDFNEYTNQKLKKHKTNINFGYFSPYKKEKLSFKTPDKMYLKSPMKAIKNEIKNKIEIPYIKTPSDKKYTLVLDLNKTLAFYNKENISLRNGLFSFLSMIKPYYELISFSCEPNDISENIIKEIETQKKYFDYNFTRQHSILYDNTLVKDISLIGRDISKIIIVDDDENRFKLNKENGIKIGVYNGNNKTDNVLFELKKILILIYKKNYEDVRIAIKEFSNDIKSKVSLV